MPTLELIAAGKVTMAVRKWKRPTVNAGGMLMIKRVTLKSLTGREAKTSCYGALSRALGNQEHSTSTALLWSH